MFRAVSVILLLISSINLYSQTYSIDSRIKYYQESGNKLDVFQYAGSYSWEKGYVVTNENDTIYGLIKKQINGQANLSIFNVIVKNEEIGKRKFRADKALGFKKGIYYYDSRIIEDRVPAYYRRRVEGKIIIYGDERGDDYGNNESVFLFNTSNDKSVYLSRLNYKDKISYLIEDDKELLQYFVNNKLVYKDWLAIISIYNER